MAKIMSNHYKFSASNHGFAGNKLGNLSPVMIKMPAASSNLRKSSSVSSAAADFFGRRVALGRRVGTQVAAASSNTMMSISIGKSLRWWEKGLQPNMKEISGAQDLVESLLRAGDKLVVVDFFSPGCGGCKALHPKICQLAEMNPDVQFLQVNYEDHKSMCYSLNVHVLPFFRFYHGADGRVCSFSCTNATIKKFKDSLVKYKPSGCSLGPPKGLDEKDLVALGLAPSFTYTPKPNHLQTEMVLPPAPVSSSLSELPLPRPLKSTSQTKEDNKDKTFVSSGR